jgi:putative DNA primase/helicase
MKSDAPGDDYNDLMQAEGLAAVERQMAYCLDNLGKFSVTQINAPDPGEEAFLCGQRKDKSRFLLAPSIARTKITEILEGVFAHDRGSAAWYRFDRTHWARDTSGRFGARLHELLVMGCGALGYGSNYAWDIQKQLQESCCLALPDMPDKRSLLPFQNGLLDVRTGELTPARPDYALDYVLPYDYDPDAECPAIMQYLHDAVDGDRDQVRLLLALLAAVLFGRADLHKFLYLLGPGGSGKSTFARLCTLLVGRDNTHATTLKALENDRFEAAELRGKRLIILSDMSEWRGNIETLTRLTGQDDIQAKQKNIQKTEAFVYGGLVVATANNPLRSQGAISGRARRMIEVRFAKIVSDEQKADWAARGGEEAVLGQELPGLVNCLMQFKPEEIAGVIRNPPAAVRRNNYEALLDNSPVAQWLITHCTEDAEARTEVGTAPEVRGMRTTTFDGAGRLLYPNFLAFCLEMGLERMSQKTFIARLVDAGAAMGLAMAKTRVPGKGNTAFKGIKLLTEGGISSFARYG